MLVDDSGSYDDEGDSGNEDDHLDDDDAPKKRERRTKSVEVDDDDVPKKCKQKSIEVEDDGDAPKKRRRREPSVEDEDSEDAPQKKCKDKEKTACVIEFKVCVYSPAQMVKPRSSHGSPTTELFSLKSTVCWDVLQGHVLTSIDEVLSPKILNADHYSISFTIPRQFSDPIAFSENKHVYLVKKALEIKKNPNMKIVVEPEARTDASKNKENNAAEIEDSDGSLGKGKKGGNRTKIPKPATSLPGIWR